MKSMRSGLSSFQERSLTLLPALLTRMSSRPKRSRTASAIAVTRAASVMSPCSTATRPPALSIARATASGCGHVARLAGAAPPGAPDRAGARLERLAPAPAQHHARALPREGLRARLADAGARARHPGDLAIELAHSCILRCRYSLTG